MPTIAQLDAALVAIDAQRGAAVVPPSATTEQVASDAATLNQYLQLRATNPFAASHYQQCHAGSLYRAMARQTEDSTGSMRAISPRHMPRHI